MRKIEEMFLSCPHGSERLAMVLYLNSSFWSYNISRPIRSGLFPVQCFLNPDEVFLGSFLGEIIVYMIYIVRLLGLKTA